MIKEALVSFNGNREKLYSFRFCDETPDIFVGAYVVCDTLAGPKLAKIEELGPLTDKSEAYRWIIAAVDYGRFEKFTKPDLDDILNRQRQAELEDMLG